MGWTALPPTCRLRACNWKESCDDYRDPRHRYCSNSTRRAEAQSDAQPAPHVDQSVHSRTGTGAFHWVAQVRSTRTSGEATLTSNKLGEDLAFSLRGKRNLRLARERLQQARRGKAAELDSAMRRFESSRPCHRLPVSVKNQTGLRLQASLETEATKRVKENRIDTLQRLPRVHRARCSTVRAGIGWSCAPLARPLVLCHAKKGS
jgi:hypothetical protein